MGLTTEQVDSLNTAFNEATLLGAELDTERCLAGLTLSLLTLPEIGEQPDDSRVQLLIEPVGRVIGSLRHGRWDDHSAVIETFEIANLLTVVQQVGPSPIYGWEFFDAPVRSSLAKWVDQLSLDWQSGRDDGTSHSLFLFQESGSELYLEFCLWFDNLKFRTPDRGDLSIDEVCANGKRWWDALNANAPRTNSSGNLPS